MTDTPTRDPNNEQLSDLRSVADIASDELLHLSDVAAGNVRPAISTGLTELDRLLGGGLRPGQLTVVTGRTGLGKSMLSTGWALAAATAEHPTVLFTMEMTRREVIHRMWSNIGRVPLNVISKPRLMTERDWQRVRQARDLSRELPLYIGDRLNTIADIQAECRRLAHKHGELGVVVVDYLQRLNMPGVELERQVGQAAHDLKSLARELGAAVVAVCQLNCPEQRLDRWVAQEADVIVTIRRDDYYNPDSPRAGEADLIVTKHRGGVRDTITVAAQLYLARFVDMA